jgi:pimeloyl-ACP methyl ester carboxylesterase
LTKPRNAPGASVEIFDTAGHMVQMEKASDVNRKLFEFLS